MWCTICNDLVDLANDEEHFRTLEKHYLENEEIQTPENEEKINIIGLGLEIEGYEKINEEEPNE